MNKKIPAHILPVIVLAQFTGTSLWFAGNAVVSDLIHELSLSESFVGFITMAVQAGFIIGTLCFAILSLADRFSPVKVFLICAIAGSLANVSAIASTSVTSVILARVSTGFFLAGIYPVGMKIASDWHEQGLGKALGYLVGALVLGTAFPHLLKFAGGGWSWKYVLMGTSVLASSGGMVLFLTVPDGPFRKETTGTKFEATAIFRLFIGPNFRSAAFGYFGHMWELYTFWAFVPVLLAIFNAANPGQTLDIALWSFIIIGIGGLSCIAGGYLSISHSSRKVAMISLVGSGVCCLLIPLTFSTPALLFLLIMLCWGIFVIPDSPQFSTLVARSSDSVYVATGLTIVNSIGFAITIPSIQLVNYLSSVSDSPFVFWVMLIGPLIGFPAIRGYQKTDLS